MKEHFDVTGMSCSACSARVEKAVKALDGIDDVNVNLLKNSMVVDFDPTKTGTEQIEDAVKKAGYSAIVKSEERGKGTAASSKPQEDIQAEELKNMETRLWVSIVFSFPLMYFRLMKPDCPVTGSIAALMSAQNYCGNPADFSCCLLQAFPEMSVYSALLSLHTESNHPLL